MKVINGFEYIWYTELLPLENDLFYPKLYTFIRRLELEYPGFKEWYINLFSNTNQLRKERQILICRYNSDIVGLAILKKELDEKKICTLRVDKKFQKISIGRNLMEMSFEWLETDKPLITIHKSKKNDFNKLFSRYSFGLEDVQWGYYRLFSTEMSFNGALSPKDTILNKFEIVDMQNVIQEFLSVGVYDVNLIVESFIKRWIERDKVNQYMLNHV